MPESLPDADHVIDRARHLLRHDERGRAELEQLVRLMALFAELPLPPDLEGWFPRYHDLREGWLYSLDGSDAELMEERFLELYAHLHMHEAPYTPDERRRVDATGGYWCHAGGLSPILRAAPWIHPATVSTDLGAGNGLQCLLLQRLYPHRGTVQVEISSRMAEIGRHLQTWLGIPVGRVQWLVTDILDLEPETLGADFIYLYRPVRPEGDGRPFYERLATAVDRSPGPVVIFSIADCLRHFLSERFHVVSSDGHLTCFVREDHPSHSGARPSPPPPR